MNVFTSIYLLRMQLYHQPALCKWQDSRFWQLVLDHRPCPSQHAPCSWTAPLHCKRSMPCHCVGQSSLGWLGGFWQHSCQQDAQWREEAEHQTVLAMVSWQHQGHCLKEWKHSLQQESVQIVKLLSWQFLTFSFFVKGRRGYLKTPYKEKKAMEFEDWHCGKEFIHIIAKIYKCIFNSLCQYWQLQVEPKIMFGSIMLVWGQLVPNWQQTNISIWRPTLWRDTSWYRTFGGCVPVSKQ